jgi:thioredoxin-like negative regulator of GroEL
VQSKTNVDADYEDRGHADDFKADKGDALAAGALGNLSDDEFEDEFGEGEEGGAVAQWRAARMAELKKKTSRTNEFLGLGHGSYSEIAQDDFLKEVTKSKYVVCHFYHPEFERCKIVDKHLELLARKHLATKWIKIDANKAPFFVGKLQVKMLPTIIFFKDGIARDRMVGLEDVGARDDFTTEQIERRIEKGGVIITADKVDEEELENRKKTANSIRQSNHNKEQSDDDEDED